MTNKTNNEKIVRIRITDNTGHTTLEQKIDEAILTVTKEHFSQGKWPYVGSRIFQFEATSLDDAVGLLNDTIRLREMLEESEDPIVVMTGALQGGV
ncbi:hypothetical protein CCP3SC5AM1_1520004 [Gammaproteobacteria bacterium]